MSSRSQYIIYARRSSDQEDRQSLSIDQQIEALRLLAARRKLEIADVLTESASAREPGRPLFGELLKRIRAGKVHGLLAWKLDRLARNMVDGGELIHHLSTGNLKEIVTPEATYQGSGDSKFMLAMFFGAAAKYSDDLASAVRRGNEGVLRKGKVPGPVPLGYQKVHDHELVPGSGTVVPDPERFETVKRLWKEVLAGTTNVTVLWMRARDEWGLTTRPMKGSLAHPIALTNLYAILRNPFYAGKIKRGSTFYKGEHPPMVTWAEFETVQELLGRRSQKVLPRVHEEFLFHGLLRCGPCGRAVIGERHEKRGHRYVYYRCTRHRPGQVICPEPEVREEVLIEAVALALDRVTIDPQIRDWAFATVAWWAELGTPSPEKLVRQAKAALARAEQELVTLTDLVVKEFISEAEYVVRRKNQLVKIDHLREALASPVEKLEAWRTLRDEKRRHGLKLGQDFLRGDQEARKKILARTCIGIVMTDGTPLLELRAPFVFRLESPDLQSGLQRSISPEV